MSVSAISPESLHSIFSQFSQSASLIPKSYSNPNPTTSDDEGENAGFNSKYAKHKKRQFSTYKAAPAPETPDSDAEMAENEKKPEISGNLRFQPVNLSMEQLKAKFDAKLGELTGKRKLYEAKHGATPSNRKKIEKNEQKPSNKNKKAKLNHENPTSNQNKAKKPDSDNPAANNATKPSSAPISKPAKKPVILDTGDLQFGQVHDSVAEKAEKAQKQTKSHALQLANRLQKKKMTPQKMLEKVEKFNEKIAELKKTDAEKAEAILHEKAMNAAMLKAQGVTVKDNAKLLKKTIKKKEKKKEKSRKEWAERVAETKEGKRERALQRDERVREKSKKRVQAKMGRVEAS